MKYFISFIEEFWQGQKEGTWIGRVGVYGKEEYPNEISIGTFKREEVEKLREKWDFRKITEKELKRLKQMIRKINE